MIKLYRDISDVKIFDFFLITYCFMMKRDYFKLKMLLWPQVPFKITGCVSKTFL